MEEISIQGDERLLILSDGVVEAEDRVGNMLGEDRVASALHDVCCAGVLLPTLTQLLDQHCDGTPQRDDITVVEFPMNTDTPPMERDVVPPTQAGWRWVMEWADRNLPGSPGLLEALRPSGLLKGLENQQAALETIVNELYANALEHGVLNLASSIKTTPEGFEAFYAERAKLLEKGVQGRICLEVRYESMGSGGRFIVRVRDSGPGFEPELPMQSEDDLMRHWGRGIAIVRELCESVQFRCNGSEVEAVYRWSG